MKNKVKLIILISLFSFNLSYSQINPLGIIDKVVGTILPTVSEGVKNIKDANRKKTKNEEATKLEEEYKEKIESAVKSAKQDLLFQLKEDIDYIKSINLIQKEVQRINSDVGKLSIYQDINFINTLKIRQAPVLKNEIIRKFKNSLDKILNNKDELESLRKEMDKISSPEIASKVFVYIESILTRIENINNSYNDCQKITVGVKDPIKLDGCLDTILASTSDISALEIQVSNLNIEASAMLRAYLNRLLEIEKSINKEE